MEATHHLAHDAGALHVSAVGPQVHVVHRVEDPALHRLQPVSGVGQRTGVDDGVGVLEERRLHLLLDVGVEDVLLEVVSRELGGVASCHGGILPGGTDGSSPATPQTVLNWRVDNPRAVGGSSYSTKRLRKRSGAMARVVVHAVVSVDGYIADDRDDVGPLFDWYFNGDRPIVEGGPFHV